MLVYKAQQVVSCKNVITKPYSFKDDRGETRTGDSIFCDVTVISVDGSVAVIRLKGKTETEVKEKMAKLTLGKPAEIPIRADEQTRGVAILTA